MQVQIRPEYSKTHGQLRIHDCLQDRHDINGVSGFKVQRYDSTRERSSEQIMPMLGDAIYGPCGGAEVREEGSWRFLKEIYHRVMKNKSMRIVGVLPKLSHSPGVIEYMIPFLGSRASLQGLRSDVDIWVKVQCF